MTSLFGQTLGKMVMGIKVVRIIPDQSDTVLHAGVAMYREFVGKLLSLMTFGIGFLMAGWSRNHRALHDMVSDTFVVLVKEKENEHE
jgi:hypothetical protein